MLHIFKQKTSSLLSMSLGTFFWDVAMNINTHIRICEKIKCYHYVFNSRRCPKCMLKILSFLKMTEEMKPFRKRFE